MDALDLLEAHRFSESIAAYQERIQVNANDWSATAGLARALRAVGDYENALPLFQRVDKHERSRLAGRPGRREDLSILHWMLGDRAQAIALMRGLVDGVLDGSIEFGDLAGGVKQGLLLYYMGVTAKDPSTTEKAVNYLRVLSKKSRIKTWPGPVALYLLGMTSFEDVLAAGTGKTDMTIARTVSEQDLLVRRNLCVALFHDAVQRRVRGDESGCMERMKECCSLLDPLVESEWYLARHELQTVHLVGQASRETPGQ
jgi:tetratricopeptide (TPR) repeat protein